MGSSVALDVALRISHLKRRDDAGNDVFWSDVTSQRGHRRDKLSWGCDVVVCTWTIDKFMREIDFCAEFCWVLFCGLFYGQNSLQLVSKYCKNIRFQTLLKAFLSCYTKALKIQNFHSKFTGSIALRKSLQTAQYSIHNAPNIHCPLHSTRQGLHWPIVCYWYWHGKSFRLLQS